MGSQHLRHGAPADLLILFHNFSGAVIWAVYTHITQSEHKKQASTPTQTCGRGLLALTLNPGRQWLGFG